MNTRLIYPLFFEADMYEFLAQKDPTCNVFGVDWSGSAINESYVFPMVNTELVGRMIAHFIRRVKMPPNRVHLIGHSLGAQIAGVVGNQFVETKIARIIGNVFSYQVLLYPNYPVWR